MIRVIGLEIANSYVKVRAQDRDPDVYINVLWPVPADYEVGIMGGKSKDPIYEIGGERLKAGYRAAGDYRTSSGYSIERYRLPQYKQEALIALARNAEDDDELHVITAVPADDHKIPSVHTDIQNVLRGIHAIRVDKKAMLLTVKSVKVISQPVATVISAAYRTDGSVLTPAILKNKKVVIDIGWGTTDVAIMIGLDPFRTFSLNVAMSTAYERIYDRIREKYPDLKILKFSAFDLEAQLRDGDTFEIGGAAPYDVKDIKDQEFARVASEILGELINRNIVLAQYDMTLFGGGGIEALSENFKRQLEGINVAKVANPQQANALGCLIYGLHKK